MPLPKHSSLPDPDRSLEGPSSNRSQEGWVTHLQSPQATDDLGFKIGQRLQGGEIIALTGDLGAGKTTLVKGIAKGVGISPEQVTSPTFTLVHEYSGFIRLIHADLYRVMTEEEIGSIGLEEYLSSSDSVIIEWADRLRADFAPDFLLIHLTHIDQLNRHAKIQAHGTQSHTLLQNIKKADQHHE